MGKNRAAWLALTLSALGLYLFENNTGTRCLFFVLLLLPALSALPLFLPRRRFTASLELPETARRGERAEAALVLEGGAGWLPLRFSGNVAVRNLFTGEESVLPLRAALRRGTRLSFSLTPAHSGALRVSLREARALDGLGLFSRPLAGAEGRVLVPAETAPLLLSLAETPDFASDGLRYSALRPGWDPSEIFRIREYAPGDPVRQIHWKLSEKTDRTLVRDFGLPLTDRMLLLADTALPPGERLSPAETDGLADLFFSVSSALLGMEIAHTAGWYDRGADRFTALELGAEDDLTGLAGAFLESPAGGGESAAAAFLSAGVERSFAHIAVFCLRVPPDAGALLRENTVTALPVSPEGAEGAPPDLALRTVSPEELRSGAAELAL